ncbi:hypothetical protein Trydic_g17206 [Trypoxylus dichotomus]
MLKEKKGIKHPPSQRDLRYPLALMFDSVLYQLSGVAGNVISFGDNPRAGFVIRKRVKAFLLASSCYRDYENLWSAQITCYEHVMIVLPFW